MTVPEPRNRPGSTTRLLGRAVNGAVARFPRSWPLMRGAVRRFSDSLAPGWDDRVQASGERHLAPLIAAIDRIETSPSRILDVGTGTGAAALELAQRYPHAQVVGIDISAKMIEQARAKAGGLGNRVRFLVADVADFEAADHFDLITMLNMPPFFERMAALLRPGGIVVNASSYGPRTPFFTPPELLERGFARHGLRTLAVDRAHSGTFYLAQLPGGTQ
jgi:SAM-dependent methyltransferase